MSWTCTLQVSDDCATDGIFDAPASTPDGADCCLACARDREIVDGDTAGFVDTVEERWPTAEKAIAVGRPTYELDDSGSDGGRSA